MNNYPFIPFIPDKKTVLRRMGSMKASFGQELETEIEDCYRKAQSAFRVRGRAETFGIDRINEDSIEINRYKVESRLLSKLLCKSTQVYLMCATIPRADVKKISAAIEKGEGLLALVLDAYASEYVDGALDVIIARKNEALRRLGQRLTSKRFSAGYGDLDIKYQRVFYDMLRMQTMDVEINDKFLLIPEKSVIALAGVE